MRRDFVFFVSLMILERYCKRAAKRRTIRNRPTPIFHGPSVFLRSVDNRPGPDRPWSVAYWLTGPGPDRPWPWPEGLLADFFKVRRKSPSANFPWSVAFFFVKVRRKSSDTDFPRSVAISWSVASRPFYSTTRPDVMYSQYALFGERGGALLALTNFLFAVW